MRASRDLAGIEDEAARSSLAELRQKWFLARGKRKAEGTCDEEFGHDLLGSGRGKDLLDTGDSRNVDLNHIDDRPDSPMGFSPPEDCSPVTPTSPEISHSLRPEGMEVDAVCVDALIRADLVGGVCLEPGCAEDGNVGVDDYVVASPE